MRFIRHYIRAFFRSNFRPIPVETAKKGELTTSLIYFTLAWTVLGMTLYYLKNNYEPSNYNSYESHGFTAFTPYEIMLSKGSNKENTLYRIKGFTVEKEVLTHDELKEKLGQKN
ncbi:uncharacterized protein TNIN_140051 [Trichonephila inaurata madagascariensis]|uniref:Uncharacterized protein n=1 Tax=Trichonephila inaurata madagascariensis TaxID=2747483 RepID=A0A8X6WV49_9ARAC|nr:uncharacterized protein TNIN_140051 [Trichonephila inaurata madagascariensis]